MILILLKFNLKLKTIYSVFASDRADSTQFIGNWGVVLRKKDNLQAINSCPMKMFTNRAQ